MIVQRLVRPFTDDELLYLEDPRKLCLVSRDLNAINVIVEVFDKLQTPLPWIDSQGLHHDAAILSVTPVPMALSALAAAAGYTGIPDFNSDTTPAGGLFALVDPTSNGAGVAWNLSGTISGSGTNGIIPGNVGPSVLGPHLMKPGSILQLGLYFDIS